MKCIILSFPKLLNLNDIWFSSSITAQSIRWHVLSVLPLKAVAFKLSKLQPTVGNIFHHNPVQIHLYVWICVCLKKIHGMIPLLGVMPFNILYSIPFFKNVNSKPFESFQDPLRIVTSSLKNIIHVFSPYSALLAGTF